MNNNNNRGGSQNNPHRNVPRTRDEAVIAEQRRVSQIQKRRRTKMFFDKAAAVAVFALISAAVVIAAIFTYIFIDFGSTSKTPDEPLKITNTEEKTFVLDSEYFSHRNGEYYVSLTKLSQLCNLTLHGNAESMTVNLDNGQSAAFDVGTRSVKISGTYSVLKNPSYFRGGHLFIPVSFFEDYCKGISAEFDKKGKVKGYNLIFDKSFAFKTLPAKESDAIIYEEVAEIIRGDVPDFKADLSEYEKYMNPENKDEYLILINKDNMLSADYVPDDLIDVADTRGDRAKQKMRLYAAKSLEALFIEMRAHGFTDVSVTSGYRSYDYQTTLFNNSVAYFRPRYGDKAEEMAATEIAIPGSSEHQSGLCIDMHNLPAASEAFATKDAYKWLYSNCADFGFILRFPKDKSDITGIIFEPWHYRYVGRYHAQKIMNEGICLEEYIARF